MTLWSAAARCRFTQISAIAQTLCAQSSDFLVRYDRKIGGKPPHSKRGAEAHA